MRFFLFLFFYFYAVFFFFYRFYAFFCFYFFLLKKTKAKRTKKTKKHCSAFPKKSSKKMHRVSPVHFLWHLNSDLLVIGPVHFRWHRRHYAVLLRSNFKKKRCLKIEMRRAPPVHFLRTVRPDLLVIGAESPTSGCTEGTVRFHCSAISKKNPKNNRIHPVQILRAFSLFWA